MKSIYKSYLFFAALIGLIACEEIDKKDPYIAWENPADMYEGDALSAVQLNAIAETDGDFIYNPPEGTVLPLGEHQKLTLKFTPYDTEHYNVVEDSVFVNVKSRPILDADGNLYTEVKIGNQIWLAEPLITTHFNNGDPISYIAEDSKWGEQTGPAFGWYQSKPENSLPWGAYYNLAVIRDERGICPEGYHIPTMEEYQEMIDYLGEGAGSKMKSPLNWDNPGNNSSGFNAPGSSLRDVDGVYKYQNLVAFLWTDTANPDDGNLNMILTLSNDGGVWFQGDGLPQKGHPVRCIKDSE